jgi:hypothetical protein
MCVDAGVVVDEILARLGRDLGELFDAPDSARP